ncbi:AAEL011829-PA [Aedes aegypti]|uniref:AAEL011829-PA n=1 Tax=Aedes aegypti TaxID=7159 RepID=Q16NX4_AEDAE|nr:AAEL011829-PA [Aedes aegypti]
MKRCKESKQEAAMRRVILGSQTGNMRRVCYFCQEERHIRQYCEKLAAAGELNGKDSDVKVIHAEMEAMETKRHSKWGNRLLLGRNGSGDETHDGKATSML